MRETGMENDFSRIVDALPGLVWTARPDGHIDFLNIHWCQYTGIGADVAFDPKWQAAIHPEDRPALLKRWQSILSSAEPGEMEARLRRFDGMYRWFLFRISPLTDNSGQVSKWCGINTDIDEKKRAEALLAGERQLLEMVMSGHPLSVILDALCQLVESTAGLCRCSVVFVDPTGTRLEIGAAPSLPPSFTASIVGQPVNCASEPCAMAVCLNDQVIAADLTSEICFLQETWCPVALAHGVKACWSMPITSVAGEVLGAFAIYYDQPRTPLPFDYSLIKPLKHIAGIVMERTQNDAALKRSETLLAETRRLGTTGGFFKRISTGGIAWSEEVYRMFEFDPALPVTLEQIQARVHPEDRPSFQEMLNQQQRGSDYQHEYRLLMPDHSIKYLHVVAHASRDQDGALEYIAAVQDVTQRRLSEDALARARSDLARVARVTSLGALTASIAHEVNQPLSGIITNAGTCLRMLAADPPNIDGARQTARRTIRDGNRAADVIKRLRALFSKQDAAAEVVDLNEAAREVIALSLSELQRGRIILRQEFADDLPPVSGDRVQLQQVILNLLLNASDAMSSVEDRPRQLVIRSERDENDYVRLVVQDTGVGFDPQNTDRLFDTFYTSKNGGMGIGLSVSRSIVESHHGRLWATLNDGPGATFSFSIPRQPENMRNGQGFGGVWTSAVTDGQYVMGSA